MKAFYNDYPYVVAFTDHKHPIYSATDYGLYVEDTGLLMVKDWCVKNCKGMFRFDVEPVVYYNDNLDDVIRNPLGDVVVFAAFVDNKDFMWFMLRWQ